MSMPTDDIRFEVRRYLAVRPSASLDLDSIHQGLRSKGQEIDKPEVIAALTFLIGLQPPQAMERKSTLNATRYQITSAGVVAYENNA